MPPKRTRRELALNVIFKMRVQRLMLLSRLVIPAHRHPLMLRRQVCIADRFRTYCASRDHMLQVAAMALRTHGRRRGAQNKVLEFIPAASTCIFVDWHERRVNLPRRTRDPGAPHARTHLLYIGNPVKTMIHLDHARRQWPVRIRISSPTEQCGDRQSSGFAQMPRW